MALGDSYATVPELETRLGQSDDGSFTLRLATASRDVEWFTGRQFNQETSASERVFRPLGSDVAIVDDFHTVTGLVIATDNDGDGVFETTWSASDYELEPLNGIRGGTTGWPYWIVRSTGTRYFVHTQRANIQVAAQWGWSAVPAGIKEATLAVAEKSASDAPGVVRSMAIDGYSTTFAVSVDDVPAHFQSALPYQRLDGFA